MRAAIEPSVRQAAEQAIAKAGLELIAGLHIGSIGAYYPVRHEVDCLGFLRALARAGHETALPVIVGRGKPLGFRRWLVAEPLEPGDFGVPVPEDTAPVSNPDGLLVPLLAFDRHGFRLGYGGGYYDATLRLLRKERHIVAIGIGFAAQEVAKVPTGALDEPVDWILTEKDVLRRAQ